MVHISESGLELKYFVVFFTGKILLEGTMAQKLNQLDKRETELLEESEKQRNLVKKLKEDRVFYRKKNEEKEYVPDYLFLLLFGLIVLKL